MSFATIEELRSQLGPVNRASQLLKDPVYRAKQLHDLPTAKRVDREKFILDHCKGKNVLEFGASGALHDGIVKVAAFTHGVDREDGPGVSGFDLDDVSQSILYKEEPTMSWRFDLIVCGEILEHLSNPGWFLTRLKRRYGNTPVIITVPNAYAANSVAWLKKGIENVNRDHVAWYSPMTLATLLQRAGYNYADLFYYNGDGPTAEGLVVVTE